MEKPHRPLVSVIMASYNTASYLHEAIGSVISQTFQDWELIIIDDCSTDDSHRVALDYAAEDSRIQPLKLGTNSGPAVARNEGIRVARGRYIAFLDSDDVWLQNKLERQLAFMEKENLALSFHSYSMLDADFKSTLSTFIVPPTTSYNKMLYRCVISMCAAMYDTARTGGKVYMPLIKKRQDYGMFLHILRNVDIAKGIEDVLLHVRIRKGSLSANKIMAAKYQWKIYRDVEGLGILISLYYFSIYALFGIKKYIFRITK